MRTTFFTPRSTSALKAAASKLQKDTPSLTRTQALDRAAVIAGFANYAHAQRNLPEVMRALTLRCRWRDGPAKGTEVLKYPLPWSADEVAAMRLKAGRIASFSPFDDGLFCSDIAATRYMARYWIVQALRELLVMQVTGFKPDYTKNHLPRVRRESIEKTYYERVLPPGADHLSAWYDPSTKASLLMDEPYLGKDEVHSHAAARAEWCKRFGFQELPSAWGGTYLPPKSRLFLITKSGAGIDLAEIESKLNTLPDDFGASDDDWRGSSESAVPASSARVLESLTQLIDSGILDEHSRVTPDGAIEAVRKNP